MPLFTGYKEEVMKKSLKIKIISVIAFLIVFAGLIWFMISGDNRQIILSLINDDLSSDEFKDLLQSFGIRGAVSLCILLMLQVLLTFVPAEPFQVLAGVGYGIGFGTLICLIGVFLGNSLVYLLYKIFGDKATDNFREKIDIDFDNIQKSKRIALIIIFLYFLPAIPYGVICFFAASINIKYPRYILLTTIGAIPSIIVDVGFGHIAIATSWIISIIICAVLIVLVIIMAIKRNALFKAVNNYIHKHQLPYKTDTVVKKPNPIFFHFMVFGLSIYLKFKYKFKYKIKDKPKGPCIVLCNHGSFADFLFSGKMLRNSKPHYVAARMYFYNKKLAWLMRNMGAFPKSMFSTDIENVKNCMKVLNMGRSLVMMPEARLSTAGKFEGIQPATFKFIKKMNVPIYILKIDGSYLSKPKWADAVRKKSVVTAELSLLIDKERIGAISEEQMENEICTALYYDDFEWLKTRPDLTYNSKTLAVGLENILHICPECGKKLTIKTENKDVFCTECGYRVTLDNRYQFTSGKFANFADWYEWQKEELKKEILSNPDYVLTSKVELKHQSLDGKTLMRHVGDGVCTLSADGLTYEGSYDGENVIKRFPASAVYRLLFGAGEDFEIYDGKTLYYFVPEDTRSCVIWYIASEIIEQNA
ncbi:MAG: VTT domain-containing protein [Clostridia bacterium]|nr:VTT domain-containing protein [Clostridia bacterium]